MVLALVAHDLQRRHAYSETELNEALTRCLARWRADVDHVTCRRYLVDLGFVKRDRAGQRYLLNFPRVEATLSPEAREQAPALLEDALKPKRKLKGA